MPVDSEHPEYTKYKCMWKDVRDAEENQYLEHIILSAQGGSERAKRRNLNFLKRARYTNYVYGTLGALVGMATLKEMSLELPSAMEYLREDCTENHMSIHQLQRNGLREIAGQGRFIMLTDFPAVDPQLTEEKRKIINPLPRIRCYKAEQLKNWDVDVFNGQLQISWINLEEDVKKRDEKDRYKWNCAKQYREVFLDPNGKCWVQICNDKGVVVYGPNPVIANGNQLDFIPIDICGAENNDACVDVPPMWCIAHLGWGILQNSASVEDNAAQHAQSTLFLTSSMTPSQWMEYTRSRPVIMGAGDGNYLGESGSATLVQTGADQVSLVLIEVKERQIVAMGGHYITSVSNNTAVGTKELDLGDKISPLVNWVKNLQQGMINQLNNCALFLGVDSSQITLQMPVDFIPRSADPQLMQSMIAWRLQGVISNKVLREYGRDVDIIPEDMTDEELDADVGKEDIAALPTFDPNMPNINNPNQQPSTMLLNKPSEPVNNG